MKEDATITMPPSPSWYLAPEAIRTVLTTQTFAPLAQNRWHFSSTRANGCLAFAVYHATGLESMFRAFRIQVITPDDGAPDLLKADMTTFLDPSLLLRLLTRTAPDEPMSSP
jgi:RNA polymerase sigma-70 factor, ECF subfamily